MGKNLINIRGNVTGSAVVSRNSQTFTVHISYFVPRLSHSYLGQETLVFFHEWVGKTGKIKQGKEPRFTWLLILISFGIRSTGSNEWRDW